MKTIFSLTLWLAALIAHAQNQTFNQDFFLKVDNDAFLFQAVDRYYSSGIFFQYRHLSKDSSVVRRLLPKSVKAIRSFQFSHAFYTPRDIKFRTLDQLDRPYAGYISLGYGQQVFLRKNKMLQFDLEAGLLGPSTKMAELQDWYHNIIGAKTPQAWRYQIEDTPLIQLGGKLIMPLKTNNRLEVYSASSFKVGTVFNQVMQGVTMRIGNFLPLENSAFQQAKLGVVDKSEKDKTKYESFFFLTALAGYRFYDATVQGNIIGAKSIHTEPLVNWTYNVKYGWMWSWYRWDFALSANNSGRETRKAENHYYITFDFVMRF
ncbi:MAG: lipid A deacylase LpxR family protein [Cyclobacteriaceae bacterium]